MRAKQGKEYVAGIVRSIENEPISWFTDDESTAGYLSKERNSRRQLTRGTSMLDKLDNKGPAKTEADIMAFEERIGRPLPHDYRVFLFAYNGGRPEHHVIRNVETGDLGVQLFLASATKSTITSTPNIAA